ncbi:MAG: ABC transporter permease [Candidatus Sulfopaludibacter sp.]|nr:ABC transporter permease [Candidatus Sulfopaludibacter sp.]
MKHSIRIFLKSPGFTLTALAALAVGIGGTTAIFSIVNTVLLRPLPVPDPERLVVLATTSGDGSAASPAKFIHWRAERGVFQDVSAYMGGVTNYTGGGVAEEWRYTRASADTFRCYGIPVLRGRTFTAAEDSPGAAPVAVIGEGLWRRRFGGNPQMLGQTISLNGEAHTVVGIVADFSAVRESGPFSDVYVPMQIDPHTEDQGDLFEVAARLKPGVSLEQARARLRVSAEAYRIRFPNALARNESFTARGLREDLAGGDRPLLLVLSGAVSLVLLIACANVANLLLARAAGRRREMAIRIALGAGRGRIIRELLAESALLSAMGGALGLLLGYAGVRALLAVNTAELPMVGRNGEAVTVDWRVMAFATGVSLLTGILFGLFPAVQGSRADLNSDLKDGGRSGAGLRHNRARGFLVMSEVGLAVVLLVGSALLIRSFLALYHVDLGFDATHVVTLDVLLAGPKYAKTAGVAEALRQGLERVRALPGVAAAGATCCLPLAQGTFDQNFQILGRPAAAGPDVGWATVSPGYFETFQIPVKHGRAFTAGDDNRAPAVVAISESLARQYWKDADPLGQRIVIGRGSGVSELEGEPVRQIVGIVGDIRTEGLDARPRPVLYVPQAQLPDAESAFFLRLLPIAWVVRTQGEPGRLAGAIREQLRQATGLPVTGVAPMKQVVWAQTGRQRFGMLAMAVFAGAALLLAAIGIYGLMAYSVEQRRQEIGIRMALGAESGRVRDMVVRQGMSLALAGAAAGLAAAWALARLMASLLFGVPPHDPVVFAAVPAVLIVVALAAVYLPAHRASRLNPMDALRHE